MAAGFNTIPGAPPLVGRRRRRTRAADYASVVAVGFLGLIATVLEIVYRDEEA